MRKEDISTDRRPSEAGTGAGRGGSALVIVIGFLAVLTLLGIAFSTFVRTEQAGATSLKNALIAKQALNTAIGRIAESIDLSFGGVSNNWAVGVWPCPWLSSSNEERQDFFQSAALATGEKPVARIVTKEIADMLTPLQRYLARSAKCSWAPIYGSLEAGTALSKPSRTNDVVTGTMTQFGQYGVEGYNGSDSVVGRYAFIALETTGLLDANCSGGGRDGSGQLDGVRKPIDGRLSSRGEDPAFFLLPDNNSAKGGDAVLKDCLATDPDGNKIPLALENAATFLSARKSAQGKKTTGGAFSSFGEIRSSPAAAAFDLDLPDKPARKDDAGHAYFPADLFSMFAPSLEDLDPDGLPKVPLPGEGAITTLPSFAPRAMLAMAKVFANASFDEESTAGNSTDYYTFFPKNNSYQLSRARLATVAMIDAMDPDVVPGKSFSNANGTGSELYAAWESLPDIEGVKASVVAANGDSGTATVSDKLDVSAADRRGDDGPLNFPCTESVPQLNRVYAYMTIDPPSEWHEGLGSNSYVRVTGKFHVGAVAGLRNLAKPDNARTDSYKMHVDCAMLLSTPRDSVASVANAPVKCNLLEQLVGVPDPDDEYAFQGLKRTWSVENNELKIGGDDVVEISVDDNTGTVSDSNDGNKMFSAEREVPFEAKLYASAYPDTGDPDDEYNQGTGQIVGDPDIVGGIHHGDYTYFPLTDAEGGSDDLYIPFRFRVTIKHEKSGKTVQQVPAPMLDKDNNGAYWIRADAAVYHHPDSSFEGEKDPDTEPWDREYAPGWAVCLEPAFAFDTSSMYSSSGIQWEEPTANGFWINNALARERELHSDDSGLRTAFEAIRKRYEAHVIGDTALIGSNEDQLTEGIGSEDEYAKGLWNVAQTDGVFDPASGFKLSKKWMSPGAKTVPDNLHAYKNNGHLQGSGKKPESYSCVYEDGGPFCMLSSGKISTPRVIAGFYSHVQNAPFESVGQLGDVMVGPYETLATVRAYRFGTDRADIHRVLDYFTTGADRFPTAADYGADGTLNDNALDEELFSGVNTGRVNLNSPVLVHWVWPGTGKTPNRIAPARSGGVEVRNPYPVAAALTGSCLWSDYHSANLNDDKRAMPASIAREIASAIVFDAGTDVDNRASFPIQVPVTNKYGRTVPAWTLDPNATARVKNRLSDLGAAEDGGVNHILKAVVENLATNSAYSALQTELVDADREAFVANSSSAFTTRGQTFLVIIRADAYTPRYGEETAEDGEGTTLATTHAVVELFRDPEFARYPDGSPLEDKDGNPVFFHNWYVKSFRIL